MLHNVLVEMISEPEVELQHKKTPTALNAQDQQHLSYTLPVRTSMNKNLLLS